MLSIVADTDSEKFVTLKATRGKLSNEIFSAVFLLKDLFSVYDKTSDIAYDTMVRVIAA